MILSLLLSILIPQLIAFVLILGLWPGELSLRSNLLLKSCLAAGVGLGILSCVYFLQLSLFGPSRKGLAATQLALLICAAAILFYRLKSTKNVPPNEPVREPPSRSRLQLILSILFIAAFVSAVVAFIFISLRQPHGEWDAWAVYNMKARFLFRAGENWRDLYSEQMSWSGPDYPLLVPATIAACWLLMGRETVIVPALVALIFTFATIGLVARSVSLFRGRTQGLLAGLVLACTPYLIMHGANQYSDIPIGFFFSATIVLLALRDKFADGGHKFLVLAGLAGGLSAWTKNEGLLFIAAIVISRFVVMGRTGGLKNYLRQMKFFAAGLAPTLSVVLFFKATVAARNGVLFATEGPSLWAKLLEFSRYITILDGVVTNSLSFGNWTVSVVPLLIFYLLLLGAGVEDKEKASVITLLVVLGIMLLGYSMVYVLSPRDVYWHLVNSINRLFSQLWPSFVFVYFLIVRTPEKALDRRNAIPLPS